MAGDRAAHRRAHGHGRPGAGRRGRTAAVRCSRSQHFARLTRWLGIREEEPAQWQEAAQFGDRILYVTAEELAGLGERVEALLDEYLDRLVRPELRPEGARRVKYLHFAFPDEPRLP